MDSEEEDFYDDSGGDWAEEGIGNDEPDYSSASSRRKHYKVLKEEDIKQLQENDISTVSGVLSVSRGVACTLLCQNNWTLSSVYENWFAVEERNSEAAAAKAAEPESGKQVCKIFYRKTRPIKMVSTTCGHPFCAKCWKKYISTAINDGVGCLTLRCPEPGCKAAVGFDTVNLMPSADDIEKYYIYLFRSYVERNRNRKWCPAPGCDRAIELDAAGSESYDVSCDCSCKFCWRCAEESHRPVECKTVAEWLEKNSSEAENTNWILAYTKPCPKCARSIEKNQGCNHMSCGAPCKFEFCWVCLEPWKGHGGGYFKCNKFEDKEVIGKDEKSRHNTKKYVERYTHYYERWDSNDKSRKRTMDDLNRARSRCDDRVVTEAWEQIVECRRVLKWSYAYGYYLSLKNKNSGKMILFECLQGQAEPALERLHYCVEKEMMDQHICEDFNKFRMNIVHLTSVTRKYFENLVVALESNLCEVEVESCVGKTRKNSKKKKRQESSKNNKSKKKHNH